MCDDDDVDDSDAHGVSPLTAFLHPFASVFRGGHGAVPRASSVTEFSVHVPPPPPRLREKERWS